MYREQGSAGIALGVDSGRYTDPPREFSRSSLGVASQKRLDDALAGTSALAPLFGDRGRGRVRWSWLVALASAAIALSLATRGPHRTSAAVIVPSVLLAPLGYLVARRLLRGRASVRLDGAYVFVTDIVDVQGGSVRVTPMGRARSAEVRSGRGRSTVVVHFDSGDRTFAMPDADAADRALAALEAARQTLVDLTLAADLSTASDVDPFFEVRLDAGWPPAPRVNRPLRLALEGAIAAALAGGVAFSAFALHERELDRTRWQRASGVDTLASYAEYVTAGGAYVKEARARIEVLAAAEAQRQLEAARPPPPEPEPEVVLRAHTPDAELGDDERAGRDRALKKAFAAYAKRAPSRHPVTERGLRLLEARLRAVGDGDVRIAFTSERRGCPASLKAPALTPAGLAAYEDATRTALRTALAEVFPAALVDVVPDAGKSGPVTLTIETRVQCQPMIGPYGAQREVGVAVVFEFIARLRVQGEEEDAFSLTMPPRDPPSFAMRDHSLFTVPVQGSDAERYVAANAARAFDRLYDELYGLFFEGDPRVPVRRDPPAAPSAPLRRAAP